MVNLLLNSGASLLNGKPIVFLTQWKIVGSSEVHGQEIWSCGEYNPTDGKYHILVQPQGGSIADIALTEPLRKTNDVADTIEFPCETEGKAIVTRNIYNMRLTELTINNIDSQQKVARLTALIGNIVNYAKNDTAQLICAQIQPTLSLDDGRLYNGQAIICYAKYIYLRNSEIEQSVQAYQYYVDALGMLDLIYELATPTTELVDAPQIEEADSYSMVISQGGKAVEWSSFVTE